MVMYRIQTKGMKPFEALIKPVAYGDDAREITTEQVKELRNKGLKINEIAKKLNCSETTVGRRLGKKY